MDEDGATATDEVFFNILQEGSHFIPPVPSSFYHLIYLGDVTIGNTVLDDLDEIGVFDGDERLGKLRNNRAKYVMLEPGEYSLGDKQEEHQVELKVEAIDHCYHYFVTIF